ncbi:MAG: precorrin-6y C5,15-methyltransferase (decarboxylating) subunit CbiE [Candidatus Bathyarchaeota archaeon]|nr:precorrin-6y C5,15-methyltransferase (decarboxylating) subunit CbiE [Candidatus Bathyarchaeota archaeon]
MAKVTIVGVGPGSPDYVTPIARRTVQKAHLVIGAQRVLTLFLEDVKGEVLALTAKNVNELFQRAIASAKEGKMVVLLSTGDPGFSGLLGTFLSFPQASEVEIEVIPGISALQVCAARLGMCWDDAVLFSFHKGADNANKAELAEALKKGKNVMLLPDPKAFSPSEIARFLIANGIKGDTSAFVCENLTLNNERITASTLEEIAMTHFSSLCVLAISPQYKRNTKVVNLHVDL